MPNQVWACRFYKAGGSAAILLPKEVRERLGFVPGDLILLTIYGPILMCRKMTRESIADRESIPDDAAPPALKARD
jgi:antitoxin component of MazEF toxin-antitoxin module